ncbi:MAG: hypothetical protein DMG64_04135 [Acidobacteria bacterium]|nr:MAG: hypothetical protein DMG64_04135 [Acidobacteriota bacterium]
MMRKSHALRDRYIACQTHCGPQQRAQMYKRELLKFLLPRIAYDLYRFLALNGNAIQPGNPRPLRAADPPT